MTLPESALRRTNTARVLSTVVLVIVTIFVLPKAKAQFLGPSWRGGDITLTSQDMKMMNAAIDEHIHGKKIGTTTSWHNPSSGNSGTLRLMKNLAIGGQKCETIEYIFRTIKKTSVPSARYLFTSCLQTDGTWKIAG